VAGKLIIVSYRLPYRFHVSGGKIKISPSSGGLSTALHSYFQSKKTEDRVFDSFHWVGVSDLRRRKFEKASSGDSNTIEDSELTLHPVFIDGDTGDRFYNGFCNAVLWPLFHYFPSYVIYDQHYYDAYCQANQIMATEILSLYTPGDTIWIHDYHFLLLPSLLRKKIPGANIGFFLHIPFPSFEVFRILPKPWRVGILEGLLGADVVGFHTDDYVGHFHDSVKRILEIPISKNGNIRYTDREIVVNAFPISIDFGKFQKACELPVVVKEVDKIRKRFPSSKLILSVDRLDYTKAIINRLEAYELFLRDNSLHREKVTYLLLLVPTRDGVLKYRENKKEVEVLILLVASTGLMDPSPGRQ
jgi:trehalose 6-phosphate synthase/phosphatase